MPTPAQIAARKKFAERARSGELAKMRKKNPVKTAQSGMRKKRVTKRDIERADAAFEKFYGFSPKFIEYRGMLQRAYEKSGLSTEEAIKASLNQVRAMTESLGKVKNNPTATRAASRKANPVIPSANYDYELITEIKLTALNDADLYRQQGKPIIDNLAKKMVKGTFDAEKAVKLYQYLADNAVKKYSVEQFGKRTPTLTILSKPEREILAQHLFEAFAEEIQDTAEQMRSRKRNPTATRSPARKRTQLVSNGERKKNPMVKTFPAYGPFRFKVETSTDGINFRDPVGFPKKLDAIKYAKLLAKLEPRLFIRVYELTAADLSYAV